MNVRLDPSKRNHDALLSIPYSQVPWVCCQLGAREHYAVARALHSRGVLEKLITDRWMPWLTPFEKLSAGLGQRFHEDLSLADVSAANLSSVTFELAASARGLHGWSRIMARNRWFQRMVVRQLVRLPDAAKPRTLFAYSYAALEPFRFARKQGWRTILGQIDPGPGEERIVSQLYAEDPDQRKQWSEAPQDYWREWRAECVLADTVVVNSEWSKGLIEEEGIPTDRIAVVPLALEPPRKAKAFLRTYPIRFDATRPLRALFLGQINLRKGVKPLFDAVRLLSREPVEFWMVGPIQIVLPHDMEQHPKVRWLGPVPRNRACDFYRQADVFILPTFSDGFGLTQLEAQAWRLPVIASRTCGEIVENGRNGWILPENTGEAIATTIRRCLMEPKLLRQFAKSAAGRDEYGLKVLGERMLTLFDQLPQPAKVP